MTPTGRPRPRDLLHPFLVAAVLLVTGCGETGDDVVAGSDGSTTSTAASDSGTQAAGDTTELCDQWAAVYDGQDEGLNEQFFAELERVAPDSLAADVATMIEIDRLDREASEGDGESPDVQGEALVAANRVMGWVQTTCAGGVRVAPPLDATPVGLEVCAAGAFPVGLAEEVAEGDLVIYAPEGSDDPFAGPALGLMWGVSGHRGDGDTTPVTLRVDHGATDAVVAPITVFQQVVLGDLGTVVAWTEDGTQFGLYGRGWSMDRSDELVAIAGEMREAGGTGADDGRDYEIPVEALPDGFGEAIRGPAEAAAVMGIGAYTVSYGSEAGDLPDGASPPAGYRQAVVTLSGSPSEPGTDELWRMFVLDSERIEVGDRSVSIADDAWGEDGPVIASWRHGDGHVVVTGMNVERQTVLDLVEASRELTDEEWMELSGQSTFC